jgi:NAD(P) transhydrogenase subunit alpha
MVTVAVAPEEAGETRVALSPEAAKKLAGLGCTVSIASGAGARSRFSDAAFTAAGARIASNPAEALSGADILLKVRRPSPDEVKALKPGAIVAAMLNPFDDRAGLDALAKSGASLFSMEFMPRISRAQSMDVLSSQANLAGYKAVVDAAAMFEQAVPMMMTAAGTVPAAKVFVMGVGVAGLQAIATARRLGAVVSGFDVRPVVKEQVQSIGATFVEVQAVSAEGSGGYAKELGTSEQERVLAAIAAHIRDMDLVITTAQIPNKPAPRLITAEMVRTMRPGSVIVDLAAESGGNCELTRPAETIVDNGVSVIGAVNVPSSVAFHASQMYGRNVTTLVQHLWKDGRLALDDEIATAMLVVHDGKVRP